MSIHHCSGRFTICDDRSQNPKTRNIPYCTVAVLQNVKLQVSLMMSCNLYLCLNENKNMNYKM